MSEQQGESGPVMTQIVRPVRPGRNDLCHCGSGKKYKKCHLQQDEDEDRKVHKQESAKAAAVAPPEVKHEAPGRVQPGRSGYSAGSTKKNFTSKSIFQRKTGGG